MTAGERPRLLVFTTHPIQYQAPWFQAIENSGQFEQLVAFSYIPTSVDQAVGFDVAFEWDVPLREGYHSTVLDTFDFGRAAPRWLRRPSRRIGALLDSFRPDVSLVLGWQEVSLIQAMRASWMRGVPVLVRGESTPRAKRGQLVRWGQRAIVKRVEIVLAIGQRNRRFYRELGVADARIVDARYCVDNERFSRSTACLRERRADLRRGLGVPTDALCVLFVGKLEPKKRPLDLIEAVSVARKRGASVYALIVGEGPLRASCERRAAELRIPAKMLGFLNQSELPEAYVCADGLVLPSDEGETWGLVVNEAMACGLPAIVSDQVGCAPDLVLEGETGETFRCGDVHALADVLVRWAMDHERVLAMGRNAEVRVRKHYSIEGAVQGLSSAVEYVLERRRNGSSSRETR